VYPVGAGDVLRSDARRRRGARQVTQVWVLVEEISFSAGYFERSRVAISDDVVSMLSLGSAQVTRDWHVTSSPPSCPLAAG